MSSTYLSPTPFLDFEHPAIHHFVSELREIKSPQKRAIALYHKVRDGFLYDPYHLDLRHEALISSQIVAKKRAWCVEKSLLMASALRALSIPSALGYAIVENHIGVERLLTHLKTSKIVFHGYVAAYLNGKWVKATPAFDRRICAIAGVPPLAWDGKSDSIFQAFEEDKQFMEYHHDYGLFSDVPIELMNSEMKTHYPHLFDGTHENSRYFSFYHL